MKITPDKPISAPRAAVFAAAGAAAFAAASLLDPIIYRAFADYSPVAADWWLMLQVAGYLPFWLAGAAAMGLIDSARPRRDLPMPRAGRACLLAAAVCLAAVVCEILKIVIRRRRPISTGGTYVFRSWLDGTFRTVDLALPSHHAMVAFAAAWILSFLHPRTAAVWLALAVGCAATRVLAGAHFLSDVVGSAFVSYAVARVVWSVAGGRRAHSH